MRGEHSLFCGGIGGLFAVQFAECVCKSDWASASQRRVGLPLQAYERVVEECGAGRTVSTITEAWDNNKEEEGNDDGFGAGDGARMVQYLKIKRWREKDIEIAQLKMKLEAMSKKPPKWLNTFGLSTSAILYSIMSLKKLPRGLKLFDNLIRFATRGLPFVPLKKI
ncbi:uncharacterized protein L3040_000712 [Drepanopeziza brunnea f. sp. 'multigermtubi']|uniref:uncharacterized protein n=1 Tax=Drepanopeziza brunnea f. sp. 'multigermtubi' TaxID=698441 RepID=UPI00238B8123|nr:hypothetical protein L3040_000712 [Drepanopeziza brunnea f. sp. 'multigermtubi']